MAVYCRSEVALDRIDRIDSTVEGSVKENQPIVEMFQARPPRDNHESRDMKRFCHLLWYIVLCNMPDQTG